MEYYFSQWLKGIVEDDPLPYEIKHMCFIINKGKQFAELSMSYSENPFLYAVPDMYFPLMAECFFYQKYFKIRPNSRQKLYQITKSLILNFFAQEKNLIHFRPNGRPDFANLTISMGFRGKKAIFLVKV